MRYAVALYMSSVLGSGVLVLPGLAAQIAGPASLIAWLLLSLASYPLAYTFASLSARKPESGGVYAFARESFGQRWADAVGWLFIVWYVSGAPVVTVIAASYLSYAIPLSKEMIYVVAALIILGTFLINYRGIVISGKVQLAVIVAIVGLLLTAVIASAPLVRLENFTPFFPNGVLPIGTAAALIFWSYLGYENVSNVAEEFKNPERDFHRSIILSVIVISALYFSVAFASAEDMVRVSFILIGVSSVMPNARSALAGVAMSVRVRPVLLYGAAAFAGAIAQILIFHPTGMLGLAISALVIWTAAVGILMAISMAILPDILSDLSRSGAAAGLVSQAIAVGSVATPTLYFAVLSHSQGAAYSAIACVSLLFSVVILPAWRPASRTTLAR